MVFYLDVPSVSPWPKNLILSKMMRCWRFPTEPLSTWHAGVVHCVTGRIGVKRSGF